MIQNKKRKLLYENNSGAVAVIVAIVIVVLIGFGALAIDLGYAYIQRTKAQNATDAAALAGAESLYRMNQGNLIIDKTFAENVALSLASENFNLNSMVFQIGHYSFGRGNEPRGFTEYTGQNPTPTNLGNYTEIQLDDMLDHINAVHVRVAGPSPIFFSKIWRNDDISISAASTAYLGFAGTLNEFEVDFPLILCKDAITDADGNLTCGIGRLIHSGQGSGQSDFNTGAWTNYSSGCVVNWNSNDMTSILSQMQPPECKAPNTGSTITLGEGLSAGGGMSANDFRAIGDCTDFFRWPQSAGNRTDPWNITVLVGDCGGANNPGGCIPIVGSVNITIVLITGNFPSGTSQNAINRRYDYVPDAMSALNEDDDAFIMPSGVTGLDRWIEYAEHYDLQIFDPAHNNFVDAAGEQYYHEMTIYALPTCTEVEPTGQTGGPNLGVLARTAVLVE